MTKFKIKANAIFEADDLDDAFSKLSKHLILTRKRGLTDD